MQRFQRFLVSLLIGVIGTQPAYAGAPVIWGPGNSAEMLNSGPVVTKIGHTLNDNGPINLVSNTDAAVSASYPTSGSDTTASRTTTSTEIPLYPVRKTALKILNNGGVSTGSTAIACFQIPASLKNTKLQVSFHQMPGAGYTAGNYSLAAYSVSSTSSCFSVVSFLTLSTDTGGTGSTLLPNSTGKFTTTFDTTSADYYSVVVSRAGGSAGATNWMSFNDIYVGPNVQPQGFAGGPVPWAPSGGWSTNATYTGSAVRYGSLLSGKLTINLTGAPSGTLSINLPCTVDSAAYGTTNLPVVGTVYMTDASTSDRIPAFVVANPGASTMNVRHYAHSATTDLLINRTASTTATAPFSFATGDIVDIEFHDIPCAEWAGSGTVNLGQSAEEWAYNSSTTDAADTTSFGYGQAGAQFVNITAARAKRVQWQYPIQPSDRVALEVTSDSGVTWYEIPAISAVGFFMQYTYQTTTDYGMTAQPISATQSQVYFGKYRLFSTGIYGAAGSDWSTVAASATYRWRLHKISSGSATGFGQVAQNAAGLVKSAGQLLGTNTNDDAATGYVGEYIYNTASTAALTSAYVTGASITLTAGDWDVTAVDTVSNSITTSSDRRIYVLITDSSSDSSISGQLAGVTLLEEEPELGDNVNLTSAPLRVRCTSTSCYIPASLFTTSGTTLYLRIYTGIFTAGATTHDTLLQARRAR